MHGALCFREKDGRASCAGRQAGPRPLALQPQDADAPVEDAGELGEHRTVVSNGYPRLPAAADAVQYFPAALHTAAALDDHTVNREVLGKIVPGKEVERKLSARPLPDGGGELHPADVLMRPVVRAPFGYRDPIAVLQCTESSRPSHIVFYRALEAPE